MDPNLYPYSRETLIHIYQSILKPRVFEEKMLVLLRQGKLGKWFSGIGQEALSVGTTLAMNPDEYILPMHRNLGVFTTRGVPSSRLIAQFQAKASGFTQGRDRSFHFGTLDYKIIGMISHLGPQLSLADGIALGTSLKNTSRATLVFTGDGATSQGEFHEALNVASVWNLPVIFVIENNGYALSTPTKEQYHCKNLSDRGIGYGMESHQIEANDILEVFHFFSKLTQSVRERPRPILVECMTFRMRGHEEASGIKYVPPELLEYWAKKDPIQILENYLLKQNILIPEDLERFRSRFKSEIDRAVEEVSLESEIIPDLEKEVREVYQIKVPETSPSDFPNLNFSYPQEKEAPDLRFLDAIRQAIFQGMEKFPEVIIMGQDIAEYGGAFKLTEGLLEKFGHERVRNTPLCESAIVGIGLGLSITGFRSIIEMQFADFVTVGFNQIVNNLAKTHYRWGESVKVLIRMPTGAGTAAGPFHSQSNEAWFIKTPGLKVVYPAFPYDAKGLFLASLEEPNPVLFFEHKYLYRSLTGPVPIDYYTLTIGKGQIIQKGTEISLVTYGLGVHWALECMKNHPEISVELIDLRSLQPWDKELVLESVKRTGRMLILHEDTLTGGFGGEIAAYISEHAFEALDAPILRCASLDTPIPSNARLEEDFLARKRLDETLVRLWKY